MSRAALILASEGIRERAIRWCRSAPEGTRLEFREPKRTLGQNAKLWATLTEVSRQAEHNGRKYPADVWKIIFMHALGKQSAFVPSLDGTAFIPLGYSSSQLSKAEMSDLLELIHAWCAENAIALSDAPAPPVGEAA